MTTAKSQSRSRFVSGVAVLLLLFIRFLPAISIYEVEELVHEQREEQQS